MKEATVVITPRDRYTGVIECIEKLYADTAEPINLLVLDLGYPRKLADQIRKTIANRPGAELVPLGRMIPMEAFDRIRGRIETPYTVFLDNDSRTTPGWLPPLIECAKQHNAALVTPLTLEREGLDEGPDMRNHIYTSEIRVVDVEGTPYLIEHKPYRRALHKDIPKEQAPTDLFELHCVMMETATLKQLDMPMMVIREHIDIGMQIHAMGRKLMAEPRSVIIFDNLKERMGTADIGFFCYRWSKDFAYKSSRLFEQRWGYKFYSEEQMYTWILRRRTYLLARWLGLPCGVANTLSHVARKLKLKKDWDPLKDPIGQSVRFYDTLPGGIPVRKDRPTEGTPRLQARATA